MIWLYIILVAVGIFSIFSVTYREEISVVDGFFKMKADYGKQSLYFVISLILGLFILLTDSKFFTATANIWYAFGIHFIVVSVSLPHRSEGYKFNYPVWWLPVATRGVV